MTVKEFRGSKEYAELIDKIKGYPIGFKFSLHYASIPEKKARALIIVIKDCIDNGILRSLSFGLDFEGSIVEEEYERVTE